MECIIETIPIDPEQARRQTVTLGDNAVGRLSPFDMPTRLEVSYREADKLFQCRFFYLTPHEPKTLETFENVRCEIGQFSYKLYAIKVFNVNRDEMSEIPDRLQRTLDAKVKQFDIKKPADQVPFMNFSFARDFLSEQKRLHLFGQLAIP